MHKKILTSILTGLAVLASIPAQAADSCAATMCMSEQVGRAPSECTEDINTYFNIRVYRKKRVFDPGATSARRMEYLEQCRHFMGDKKAHVNARYGMLEYSPFTYTGMESEKDFSKKNQELGGAATAKGSMFEQQVQQSKDQAQQQAQQGLSSVGSFSNNQQLGSGWNNSVKDAQKDYDNMMQKLNSMKSATSSTQIQSIMKDNKVEGWDWKPAQ